MDRWVRLAAPMALIAAASGACTGPWRQESLIHFDSAQRFDRQGDYVSAREAYRKALSTADPSDRATVSLLTFNYARMSGYDCDLPEAEKHLRRALAMEERLRGSDNGTTALRELELGRFYFDQGRLRQAADHYARALPVIEATGILDSDPAALVDSLEEYALALTETGRPEAAAVVKQYALRLRHDSRGPRTGFLHSRYKCGPPARASTAR